MYSLSKYNYVIKNENKRIVYNLYTQALIELKSDEYKKLMELDKQSPYRDNYIELGFWVDYDETDEILRINQQNINCDTTLYMTLRMTDACNFRCPYCYQGHENSRLDSEKIEIIKRMLAKKIPGCEDVYIHYFGGEPLLNLEGILDIDQFIKSFKQDYIASMTTNGFLLSEEALEKIKYTNIKNTDYLRWTCPDPQ